MIDWIKRIRKCCHWNNKTNNNFENNNKYNDCNNNNNPYNDKDINQIVYFKHNFFNYDINASLPEYISKNIYSYVLSSKKEPLL